MGTNTYVTRRQTCPCRIPCAEPLRSETICPVVSIFVSSQTAALFEKIMGKQLVRSLTQVRYISYNKAKFKISKGDKLWLS